MSGRVDPGVRETWLSWLRDRIEEWGPIDKDVLVLRCQGQMPPGYAWHRWVIDTKQVDVEPEPTRENYEKAKRSLVLWLLRQLRRDGWLIEKNGKIKLNPKRKLGKIRK